MSRHFNYELNESRIKLLLQKNSMSFSEDVWNEFLAQTKPIEKVSKLPSIKLNFAINKSVLLTAVFIVLIGSFTMLIAKFVDFSDTKSNTENVREVKPEPDNFKLEKMATALPKKEENKPTTSITPVTSTMNVMMPNITGTTSQQYASVPTNTYTPATITPTFASAGSSESNKARTMPDTSVSGNKKDTTSVVTQTPNNQPRNLRRRKKKEAETLETKTLNQELPIGGNTEEQEPELKLN